jgi:hypothetical protein
MSSNHLIFLLHIYHVLVLVLPFLCLSHHYHLSTWPVPLFDLIVTLPPDDAREFAFECRLQPLQLLDLLHHRELRLLIEYLILSQHNTMFGGFVPALVGG